MNNYTVVYKIRPQQISDIPQEGSYITVRYLLVIKFIKCDRWWPIAKTCLPFSLYPLYYVLIENLEKMVYGV
jgi:hypothetical protein